VFILSTGKKYYERFIKSSVVNDSSFDYARGIAYDDDTENMVDQMIHIQSQFPGEVSRTASKSFNKNYISASRDSTPNENKVELFNKNNISSKEKGIKKILVPSITNPPKPGNHNTVISMISFGNAANTFLAERAIRSLRKSGNFSGYIMLLTDKIGSIRYNETLLWDPKTIVMQGRDEDYSKVQSVKAMVFKRFKTLQLSYLNYDTRLSLSTKYVLYIDIDTVCSNRVNNFFNDLYLKMTERQIFVTNEHSPEEQINSPKSSFLAYNNMGKLKMFHSGFMFFDRIHSVGCLNTWKWMFDNVKANSDQSLLAYAENKKHNCVLFALNELKRRHYTLARASTLISKDPYTFAHITNSHRSKVIPIETQDTYLRKALMLEKDELITGNITWEEAIRSKDFKHSK